MPGGNRVARRNLTDTNHLAEQLQAQRDFATRRDLTANYSRSRARKQKTRAAVTVGWYKKQAQLKLLTQGRRIQLFPQCTIDEIFEQFDEDNSGTIDAGELERLLFACSLLDERDPDASVKMVLDALDTNKDGLLDYDELEAYFNGMLAERKIKEREEQEERQKERQKWLDRGIDPDSPMFEAVKKQMLAQESGEVPSFMRSKVRGDDAASPSRKKHRREKARLRRTKSGRSPTGSRATTSHRRSRSRSHHGLSVSTSSSSSMFPDLPLSPSARAAREDIRLVRAPSRMLSTASPVHARYRRIDEEDAYERTARMRRDGQRSSYRAVPWTLVQPGLTYTQKYQTAFDVRKRDELQSRKKFVAGNFVVCDHKRIVAQREAKDKSSSARVHSTGGPYRDQWDLARTREKEVRSKILGPTFYTC